MFGECGEWHAGVMVGLCGVCCGSDEGELGKTEGGKELDGGHGV